MGLARLREERLQREEEEKKAEQVRRALEEYRRGEREAAAPPPVQGPPPAPAPLPDPWQRPVFGTPDPGLPTREAPPLIQMQSPGVDTGVPSLSSSQERSPTVQSQLPQAPMPGVQPRPMSPELQVGLSDRLRDPYTAPNRPMLPVQAQGPAAQPDPWQRPTFGQTDVPRYELQSDEPYGMTQQRVLETQGAWPRAMGEGLNQFGQAIGQRAQDFADWWSSTPAYQMAQAREQERREETPPSVLESTVSSFANAGGANNPMLSIPAALAGAGFGALGQTDWGREFSIRGQAGLDYIFDVPQHAISDTPIPGIDASIAEFLTPTVRGATQAMQNLGEFADPSNLAQTNANLFQWLSVYTAQQLGKSKDLRKQVQTMVEQGETQANLALYNISTGADAVASSLDLLVNRDEKVARLQQMALDAQNSGDPVRAGEYFLQAQEMQRMSYADMVDMYTSPIASIAYGIVFDPSNFVGPLIALTKISPFAQNVRRATKAINVNEAEAVLRLNKAAQSGQDLTRAMAQGPRAVTQAYNDIIAPFQSAGERLTDMSWLLARTNESKAAMDTERIWQGLTGIMSGITNKQDARIVLDTLLTEPGRLVQGIGNLSQDAMTRLAQSDGFAHWGAGLVGDNDFVRRLPLLGTVRDELAAMRSLAGEGMVNPYEFFAELHGIVSDATRRANGARLPNRLPFGASKVEMVRLGPDNAVVAYLNDKGNVIQRGVEASVTEVQRRVNEINKAVRDAGKKGVVDYARVPADIQRAIMSDVWLGARPANWLGNALGATTSLFANDAYTLTPISQVQDYLGKKFGGVMPNQRLQEVANPVVDLTRDVKSEISSGALDWLGRTITRNPDNPLSRTMRALYDIPYGSTEIKLPGGLAIPFGEGAFYSRAFYVPFMRTFNAGVVESINRDLVPILQQVEGMTPQMAKRISDQVIGLAQNGSKSDVAQGIRQWVGKPEVKMTLRDLGVPPELLTPQAARQIEQFISDAAPSQANQVMAEISRIIAGERNPAASVLNIAPSQPGIYNWTDTDMAEEAAWMADTFVRDAMKAGQDVTTATQEATALATRYLQDQQQTFQRVFDDMAGMPNTPDTWSVVMDFWQDVTHTKAKGRGIVDELGKRAVSLNTPDAWTEKWQGTQRVYDAMRTELARLGDETRLALSDVLQGGTYQPKHDWWETIEGYIAWDEEAFAHARAIELGSPDVADMAQWQEVITRNREYIDNSVYELFGAFQRYPNLENFDIVRTGLQKLEAMGAQVRYNLDQLLDKLVAGEMSKADYARARNLAWNNYFDAGVQLNGKLGEAIVRNGVLADAGVDLKWVQDGIEYQLARPSTTPNKFWARNLQTGMEEEFSAATAADEFTPFTVPKNVVDDYNRLAGNEKALDEATAVVMQEISDSAPDVLRPVEPDYPYSSSWDRETGAWVGEGPDPRVSSEPRVTTMGDIAKMDVEGARDTRKAMAAEWDRVATGEWGLPKLDQVVMTYNRGGGVNMNLNAGEVRQFENLYGTTIGGMPIDNLDDVQRFVQQYVDLNKRVQQGEATVSKSKQFAKMSAQEILAETRDELIAAGFSDSDLRELGKNRRSLLDILASVRGEDVDGLSGMVAYDYSVPSVAQLLGLETPEEVAGNTLRDWIFRSRRTGNATAPQVAEVAEHTIRSLNDLERTLRRRMPEILQGAPNELNGAQRLRVVDAVLDWLPDYDNQLARAQQVGDRMAGWMMLNYQDRRNFDTLINLAMVPYHYFWSRMLPRVVMGALTKPSLVNLYYEANRAVGLENEQAGIPARLEGTLPIPGTNARFNAMAPFHYAIPAMSYLQTNPFVEEDPEATGVKHWTQLLQKYNVPLGPLTLAVSDFLDNGKMDNYYGDVFNSMIPIPGIGAPVSSVYQRMTGDMPAREGTMARFGFGPDTADDGFGLDAYRARRAVTWISEQEGIDSGLAGYAQQVIANQFNGDPVEKDIPPDMLEAAIALAQRGVRQAAEDRIVGRGAAYGTTMSVQPFTEAEQEMKRASDRYYASAYDEATNPLGSKQLQRDQLDADPSAPLRWSASSETPGVDAQISALYDEAYATGEWDRIRPQIDALEAQKAEIKGEPATPPDPYRGMNPTEKAAKQQSEAASVYWDEYLALENNAEKAKYLRDNPEFQEIYKQNIISKGEEPKDWWSDYAAPKGDGKKGAGAVSSGGTGDGLAPGSVSRDDFGKEQLDQYYAEYFGFNADKDWDGQKAWLLEHPEFARLEADRKFDKDGEYPWWYVDVFGEDGQASVGARRVSQPTSVADVLRRPYDLDDVDSKTGGRAGGTSRQGGSGSGSASNEWSTEWDAYRELGDDWDAKRQFMLDNPEFAEYYIGRYGEEAAWWLNDWSSTARTYTPRSYGGYGGGGGGGGSYVPRLQTPNIQARGMNPALWQRPQMNQWIPYSRPNPDWLQSGRELAPPPIRRWERPRW